MTLPKPTSSMQALVLIWIAGTRANDIWPSSFEHSPTGDEQGRSPLMQDDHWFHFSSVVSHERVGPNWFKINSLQYDTCPSGTEFRRPADMDQTEFPYLKWSDNVWHPRDAAPSGTEVNVDATATLKTVSSREWPYDLWADLLMSREKLQENPDWFMDNKVASDTMCDHFDNCERDNISPYFDNHDHGYNGERAIYGKCVDDPVTSCNYYGLPHTCIKGGSCPTARSMAQMSYEDWCQISPSWRGSDPHTCQCSGQRWVDCCACGGGSGWTETDLDPHRYNNFIPQNMWYDVMQQWFANPMDTWQQSHTDYVARNPQRRWKSGITRLEPAVLRSPARPNDHFACEYLPCEDLRDPWQYHEPGLFSAKYNTATTTPWLCSVDKHCLPSDMRSGSVCWGYLNSSIVQWYLDRTQTKFIDLPFLNKSYPGWSWKGPYISSSEAFQASSFYSKENIRPELHDRNYDHSQRAVYLKIDAYRQTVEEHVTVTVKDNLDWKNKVCDKDFYWTEQDLAELIDNYGTYPTRATFVTEEREKYMFPYSTYQDDHLHVLILYIDEGDCTGWYVSNDTFRPNTTCPGSYKKYKDYVNWTDWWGHRAFHASILTMAHDGEERDTNRLGNHSGFRDYTYQRDRYTFLYDKYQWNNYFGVYQSGFNEDTWEGAPQQYDGSETSYLAVKYQPISTLEALYLDLGFEVDPDEINYTFESDIDDGLHTPEQCGSLDSVNQFARHDHCGQCAVRVYSDKTFFVSDDLPRSGNWVNMRDPQIPAYYFSCQVPVWFEASKHCTRCPAGKYSLIKPGTGAIDVPVMTRINFATDNCDPTASWPLYCDRTVIHWQGDLKFNDYQVPGLHFNMRSLTSYFRETTVSVHWSSTNSLRGGSMVPRYNDDLCVPCLPGKFTFNYRNFEATSGDELDIEMSYQQQVCSDCGYGWFGRWSDVHSTYTEFNTLTCKQCPPLHWTPGVEHVMDGYENVFWEYQDLLSNVPKEVGHDCLPCNIPREKFNIDDARIEALCLVCPNGKYAQLHADNTATCIECPVGTFSFSLFQMSVVDGYTCQPCEADSFKAATTTGQSACTYCPSPKYFVNTTQCQDCPAGTYAKQTYMGCAMFGNYVGCPGGLELLPYEVRKGVDDSCVPCERYHYSSSGYTACDECLAGSLTSEDQAQCTPCATGKFLPVQSQIGVYGDYTECEWCRPNEVSDEISGSRYCVSCPKDLATYDAVKGNPQFGSTHGIFCLSCPPNTYADQGACKSCDSGYVRLQENAAIHAQSTLPRSHPIWESQYQDIRQYVVPRNRLFTARPSNYWDTCRRCPPGYMWASGGLCVQCEPGKYSTGDTLECELCQQHTYMPASGATSCYNCAPNELQLGQGKLQCDKCDPSCSPSPEYPQCGNMRVGNACAACSPGQRADDVAGCVDCPMPHYKGLTDRLECEQCEPGKFSTESGSTTCVECFGCPDQHYNTGCQTSTCVPCEPCEDGYERVGCLNMPGKFNASGECRPKQILRDTAICPSRDIVRSSVVSEAEFSEWQDQKGLSGFSFVEVFGTSHLAANFQCRHVCDGTHASVVNGSVRFGVADTGYCGGPYGCNVQSCTMTNALSESSLQSRIAAACPVEDPVYDTNNILAYESARLQKCQTCDECGSNAQLGVDGWGRGCAVECSNLLCEVNSIFDWTRRRTTTRDGCVLCNQLSDIRLCPQNTLEAVQKMRMHVSGLHVKLGFVNCVPKNNLAMTISYGDCIECKQQAHCAKQSEYHSACTQTESTCTPCVLRNGLTDGQVTQHTYAAATDNGLEDATLYCQLLPCVSPLRTGLTDSGAVCDTNCRHGSCLSNQFALPCVFPHNERCFDRHPPTTEERQYVGYAPAALNLFEPEQDRPQLFASFENVLLDLDARPARRQCVWNARGVVGNTMNPGGYSQTFYDHSRECQEWPDKSPDFPMPVVPLQNVAALDVGAHPRHVMVNSSAYGVVHSEQPHPHIFTGNIFLKLDMWMALHALLHMRVPRARIRELTWLPRLLLSFVYRHDADIDIRISTMLNEETSSSTWAIQPELIKIRSIVPVVPDTAEMGEVRNHKCTSTTQRISISLTGQTSNVLVSDEIIPHLLDTDLSLQRISKAAATDILTQTFVTIPIAEQPGSFISSLAAGAGACLALLSDETEVSCLQPDGSLHKAWPLPSEYDNIVIKALPVSTAFDSVFVIVLVQTAVVDTAISTVYYKDSTPQKLATTVLDSTLVSITASDADMYALAKVTTALDFRMTSTPMTIVNQRLEEALACKLSNCTRTTNILPADTNAFQTISWSIDSNPDIEALPAHKWLFQHVGAVRWALIPVRDSSRATGSVICRVFNDSHVVASVDYDLDNSNSFFSSSVRISHASLNSSAVVFGFRTTSVIFNYQLQTATRVFHIVFNNHVFCLLNNAILAAQIMTIGDKQDRNMDCSAGFEGASVTLQYSAMFEAPHLVCSKTCAARLTCTAYQHDPTGAGTCKLYDVDGATDDTAKHACRKISTTTIAYESPWSTDDAGMWMEKFSKINMFYRKRISMRVATNFPERVFHVLDTAVLTDVECTNVPALKTASSVMDWEPTTTELAFNSEQVLEIPWLVPSDGIPRAAIVQSEQFTASVQLRVDVPCNGFLEFASPTHTVRVPPDPSVCLPHNAPRRYSATLAVCQAFECAKHLPSLVLCQNCAIPSERETPDLPAALSLDVNFTSDCLVHELRQIESYEKQFSDMLPASDGSVPINAGWAWSFRVIDRALFAQHEMLQLNFVNFGKIEEQRYVDVDNFQLNPLLSTMHLNIIPSIICADGMAPDPHICRVCPAGTFARDGAVGCNPCAPGHYQAERGQPACKPCEAGKASAQYGAQSCTDCAVNSSSTSTGNTACAECSAGQYVSNGVCEFCEPGTFSTGGLPTACGECPAGSYADFSKTVCQTCPVGKFHNLTKQVLSGCKPCPVGTYHNRSLQGVQCQNCPRGTYGVVTAATSVNECVLCLGSSPEGSASPSDCRCDSGFHRPFPASPCTQCPQNAFSNSDGATDAQTCFCNAGYYMSEQQQCVFCDAGKYSNAGEACQNCQTGTFSANQGSSSCSECPLAYTSAAGSSSCILSPCQYCDAGKYSGERGSSQCEECQAGSYALNMGATECTACAAGTYQTRIGAFTSCDKSEAGAYVPTTAAAQQEACLPGTYSSAPGATSCLSCPPGKVAGNNNTECQDCWPGFYSPDSGLVECLPCQGERASDFAATACTTCAHGLCADEQKSSCEQCPGNTSSYNGTRTSCDSAAVSSCDDVCPLGMGKPSESDKCAPCEPGFYNDKSWETDACTACPDDTFSDAAGRSSCQICAAGFSNAQTGHIGCSFCAQGKVPVYIDGKHDRCEACEAGFYNGDSRRNETCQLCPENTFSAAGAAACAPCPKEMQSAPGSRSMQECRYTQQRRIITSFYIPTLQEIGMLLDDGERLMRGNDTSDWERLFVTVALHHPNARFDKCTFRIHLSQYVDDTLALIDLQGIVELGCEIEIQGSYGDCVLAVPTFMRSMNDEGRAVVGALPLNDNCLRPEHMHVTLKPFNSIHDCDLDHYWSQSTRSCRPCKGRDDAQHSCSPGQYRPGCDILSSELFQCTDCPRPAGWDDESHTWVDGICAFECKENFYREDDQCKACTTERKTQCRQQDPAGQMWQACSRWENEKCVPCPTDPFGTLIFNQRFVVSAVQECETECLPGFRRKGSNPERPCVPCTTLDELQERHALRLFEPNSTESRFVQYYGCQEFRDAYSIPCNVENLHNSEFVGSAPGFDEPCPQQCLRGFYASSEGGKCQPCDDEGLIPGTYEYVDAACSVTCNESASYYNRLSNLSCVHCDAQCGVGNYLSGPTCKQCLPCHRDAAPAGAVSKIFTTTGALDDPYSCGLMCPPDHYEFGVQCVQHTTRVCTENEFYIPGSVFADSECVPCATCEGMRTVVACTNISDAVCELCPAQEGVRFTSDNCSIECMDGFFLDSAAGNCTPCDFTCAHGFHFSPNRTACEDCDACSNAPADAEYTDSDCTWSCKSGFVRRDDQCLLFSTNVVKAPTFNVRRNMLSCPPGYTPSLLGNCHPCATPTPPLSEQNTTWTWSEFDEPCVVHCKEGYFKHRASSAVQCLTAEAYQHTFTVLYQSEESLDAKWKPRKQSPRVSIAYVIALAGSVVFFVIAFVIFSAAVRSRQKEEVLV